MRQLKFRAWDESRRCMHTSPKWVEFKINSQGVMTAKNFNIQGKEVNLPIMQFTGLLDSNGDEIYEGDVIEAWGQYLQIKWVEEDASFFAVSSTPNGIMESGQEWSDNCRVVGDIYRNGDLL